MEFGGFFVKKNDRKVFSRESIVALNTLIETLENKFEVELILTTFWRRDIDKCRQILKNNGLFYSKPLKSIPILLKSSRLREVGKYLKENNRTEFLMLDDSFKAEKQFGNKNIIETNLIDGSLTVSSVMNYIDTFHKDLSQFVRVENIYFEQSDYI